MKKKDSFAQDKHKEFADAYKSCLYWISRYADLGISEDDENEILSFITDELGKMARAFEQMETTVYNLEK